MSEQRSTREPGGPPPARATRWTWLLVIPLLGTLIPPLYNVRDPELLGFPFFYWYQIAWIPLSVAITAVVYRAMKRGGRP